MPLCTSALLWCKHAPQIKLQCVCVLHRMLKDSLHLQAGGSKMQCALSVLFTVSRLDLEMPSMT